MVGRRLLHFDILAKLGEGGMGVVYKARDTHLDRLVAIKVLPAEKVADPDRKRRFIQEAKAASAINHPNIVTIYDITQAEGLDFIVMEHVEGKTLDALIPRAGLRLSEVLKLGVQVAQALAAAHAKGIVHRDLKPANVMVAQDGAVKVLDFGLAKLKEHGEAPVGAPGAEAPGLHSDAAPTRSAPLTGTGVVLGTAAYMSPEQAEGKPVDARSDVFSFGAVLYEMATGRRAFAGDSWASTMSAVLSQEPKPLEGLPHDLEKTILRCLRKDPAKRFQHVDDVSVALQELKEESDSGKLGAAATTAPRRSLTRTLAYVAAVAGVLVAAAAVAWWRWAPTPRPTETPAIVPLTTFPGFEYHPTFSPDGRQVAFSWNGPNQDNFDIYVMVVGTMTPVRVTTDPAPDLHPAWSPDGRRLAFVRSAATPVVMLVPALGGPERVLAKTVVAYARTDWLPYGQGLDWSPDGKYVAFASRDAEDGPSRIVMMSPDSDERRELTSPPAGSFGDAMPRFSPDGKTLAFFRRLPDLYWKLGVISLSPAGSTVTFIEAAGKHPYMPPFAWTRDSRELVGPFVWEDAESRLWRVPADGHAPPVPVVGAVGSATDAAVAPEGGYLAYSRSEEDTNIWRLGLTTKGPSSAPEKLVSSTRLDLTPEYSPDGRHIVFTSARSGHTEIWACDADGSNPTQVTQMRAPESGSPRWSPDGRAIAFDSDREGQVEIYTVTADGGPPRRLTNDPATDCVPTWSRDGRSIYFTSDRSGARQLWKVPAEGGTPVQVTRDGGVNAFESEDGQTLYYVKDIEAAGLWKIPISGGEEVRVLDAPEPRRWGAVAYVRGGVYYIARERAGERASSWAVFFHEFKSGQTERIARIDKPLGYFARALAVSPDRRWLLFNQVDTSGSDLMLLENFR